MYILYTQVDEEGITRLIATSDDEELLMDAAQEIEYPTGGDDVPVLLWKHTEFTDGSQSWYAQTSWSLEYMIEDIDHLS